MTAPLDHSILELLRGSSLAPLIDRPVNDILRDMGLGPLPQIQGLPPLPDMPPMPTIDLSALTRPFTDLQSAFGTGVLNAAGGKGIDPTQALTGITQGLQTATQLGMQALQMVMQLWQGQAAQQAAAKAGQAADNSADVAEQGIDQKGVLGEAATSVAVGGALLAAIIAKYIATMIASSPLLGTPGGQYFLIAQTAESLAEATATVAKTKLEMLGHSANMTRAGRKRMITNAPSGVGSSAQDIQQLMQMVQPLMQFAQSGMQSATQLAPLLAPKVDPTKDKDAEAAKLKEDKLRAGDIAHAGGPGPGAVKFGGGPGVAPVATPLSPWGTNAAGSLPGGLGSSSPTVESAAMRAPVINPQTAAASGSPGYMPMGGAAGAAAAARGGDAGTVPSHLITAQHGDEVVGNIDGVSLPVVGAAEHVTEPPPDKELTL
ncbi:MULTISPECIES: hypothetical protein [unclassified Nocardia]|uniref:hypothetical protein n=1 Tax=unclassified Nocardia TaxID=2637762 RepID=UPI001CE3C6C1|nr:MULTISPECIES: hypothetical protein [unclassified Nocardia]